MLLDVLLVSERDDWFDLSCSAPGQVARQRSDHDNDSGNTDKRCRVSRRNSE